MGASNCADKVLYVLSEDGTVPPTDNAAMPWEWHRHKSNSQFYGRCRRKGVAYMFECKASMHIGKKYNLKHNTRGFDKEKWNTDGHIYESRSALNEVLINKSLRDFFEETFADAIEKYNDKNKVKHADRCTTVSKYFNEQKRKVQESILQVGDADTYKAIVKQFGQQKADEFYKKALKKAFEKWQEDNPSLKVFGAYIHLDEATPHLHLDFLPVAESSRGMTTKVSLEGALKQIGFSRSKDDKYDKTPYKRWLSDRRQGYEDFWQKTADELLGKDVIKILPSEPTAAPHRETWEHREVQKGLAKVTDFVTGKGSKKVAAAEEIIANAKQVNKALCDEGNQRIAAAQRREGAAARIEKAVENKKFELNKSIEDYNAKEEELRHNAQELNVRITKQNLIVEKEVQRRLAPSIFAQLHQQENERYLQKQRSIFAEALEQQQQKGQEEQQRKQQLFEKVKHKTTKKTKGDWER